MHRSSENKSTGPWSLKALLNKWLGARQKRAKLPELLETRQSLETFLREPSTTVDSNNILYRIYGPDSPYHDSLYQLAPLLDAAEYQSDQFGLLVNPANEWFQPWSLPSAPGCSSDVGEALRALWQLAHKLLREAANSLLSWVHGQISLHLRAHERHERLFDILATQRSWFLHHGAHPPRHSGSFPTLFLSPINLPGASPA
jgi:hypothetical protein